MDYYSFLHGYPMSVPGSRVNGVATRGNSECGRQFCKVANEGSKEKRAATEHETYECEVCAQEHESRSLVAMHPNDERFQSAKT